MKLFRSHRLAALLAAVAVLACPAAAGATSSVADVTDATTGMNDAGSLIARDACPPMTNGRATCEAAFLAPRSNSAPVHPSLRRASSPDHVVPHGASRRAGVATEAAAAPAPQAGTPAYLQQAYDLSYLSQTAGGSDTVAIVDAYDDPTAESDLATYRANFDLPPCTTQNGCFRKVNQAGGQSYPSPDAGWAVEMSLDLDSVSALCPNCHIILVEANSNSFSDLLAAEAEADALGAKQISDSWAGASSSPLPGSYTFPGVATVAATGDNGYDGPGWDAYPAALPGVNAAGGTTLLPSSSSAATNPRGFTDSAWSGGGSGCDMAEPKPAWQSDSGCTGRSYADLSADADPNTGMIIYDSGSGGWMVVGGTSEATPLISAYFAVTGANASSPAWAYQNAQLLNDPQSGSNGSCAASISYICNARVGYDGPTGAGSISGAVVPGAPGIGGPGASGSYTQAVSTTSATLAGGVFPNGRDTSYWWEYGTTTAYGQQTTATDAGPGTSPVTATSSLSGLQPDTTYHYRLVAQNSFGISYGYDYSFATSGPTPTVGGLSATPTSTTAVTLGGAVNPEGTTGANYYFDYGTTSAYGHSTTPVSVSGTANISASAVVTGLAPGTTYHYRLSVGPTSSYVRSSDGTFTTPTAPTVSAVSAAATGTSAATLTGALDAQGSPATYYFSYGTTSAYGQTTATGAASGSASTPVSAAITGLLPATTYHYTLTITSSWGTASYKDQTFTTPAAPVVGNATAAVTGSTTATLTGAVNAELSQATYYFSYGATTGYGHNTTTVAATGNSSTSASATLSGLAPGTTYHYTLTITSTYGTASYPDQVFTTLALPTVASVSASASGSTTASFTGTVNPKGSTSASYFFAYGVGNLSQWTTAAPIAGSSNATVSATISGLTPGTTYTYTLIVQTADERVAYPNQTFTTLVPPTISAASATATGSTAATVSGTVNVQQASTASYYFSYGTTTAYGQTTPSATVSGAGGVPVSQSLTGLKPGTTYHYSLTVVSNLGTVSYHDQAFTTPASPTVTNASASVNGTATATLSGTVNAELGQATYHFAYGTTVAYGQSTPSVPLTGSAATPVSASLAGLAPGTTYHYTLTITSPFGTVIYPDQTFTTAVPPTVPAAGATGIAATVATLTGTVNSGGAPSSHDYFSYGTTAGYGHTTANVVAAGSANASASASLTGLAPGTTYHYTLTVVAADGTVASYRDQTFTTLALPTVSAASAIATGPTTASLTGTLNPDGSPSATYFFAYGPGNLSQWTNPAPISGGSNSPVTATLSGLTPGTTYDYALIIETSTDRVAYATQTFTTPAASTVTAVSAGVTGAGTATLSGTINPAGQSSYSFSYGTSSGYGQSTAPTVLTGSANTTVSQKLTGLQPGTTYHYTLTVTNSYGTVAYKDQTFTMPASPLVSNATAGVTGSTTATLTGTVNAELGQATYYFSYGTTTSYGHTTTSVAATGNASTPAGASLSGLTPGTTYHYTLTITSPVGTFTYPDQLFTTLPLPTIPAASGTATGATTAAFTGTVNPEGSTTATYFFAYGIGNLAHWTNPAPVSGSANATLSATVSGLAPATTYEYTLIVQTGDERVAYPNQTFTTP